ncbi:MAG: glycosyltransferase family 9 protein [Actinobacteria bacterium]|nr:glycosyltransferase family 9 protein [Actinomycetota bacterium]
MYSVLIVRLSAIGDIVMASPLPQVFKDACPQTRITWVVEPQVASLVNQHELVDRVVVFPKERLVGLGRGFHWLDLVREIRAFLCELRQEPYDLALDLQGLAKSGILVWLSGARERVGLGSREGSKYLMTRVEPRGGDPSRIGSEYLFLARRLGLDPETFWMHVGLSKGDEAEADSLTKKFPQGYVVACPFTTRPQKHWVEQHWSELGIALNATYHLPVILLGGPKDQAAAARIQAKAYTSVDNLVGTTSLTIAAAIIRRSSLVVGVDTGLTHMGPAFNVPTVALFGSTCPYLETGRDNTVVIYHDLPCAPCKRNPTCEGRFDCLTGITVEEVLAQVEQLLPEQGETA